MLCMTITRADDDNDSMEVFNINQEPTMLTVFDYDKLVVDETKGKVKQGNPWFIKFYAPWCGHCQKLAPTWKQLYQEHGHSLNVATVDCTDEDSKLLCSQFEIRGFPTLIFLKDSKAYTYRKQRALDGFVDFAKDGYLEAEAEHVQDIPVRLEGIYKLQKEALVILKQVTDIIDAVFENEVFANLGLGKVPKFARYGFVVFMISTPIFGFLLLLVIDSDEDHPKPPQNKRYQVTDQSRAVDAPG